MNMAMEWPTIIEGGIPILGGLYATALGYGVIGGSQFPPNSLKQTFLSRFKWLGPAVVLFGVFTAWQTHAHVRRPSGEELARQISARLSFPVKVDKITQEVGVEGKGDDLIYRYSIAASLADLGGRDRVQHGLDHQLQSAACRTKDFQTLLRSGYTVYARYSFEGSPEEILVSVAPRFCGY
jgi:hypothetical protein